VQHILLFSPSPLQTRFVVVVVAVVVVVVDDDVAVAVDVIDEVADFVLSTFRFQ